MKTINQSILLIIVFAALFATSSCHHKHDPTPSTEDLFIKSASQTWVLGTVTESGKDVTSTFTGFTFTLNSDKTYSSSGSPLHNIFLAKGLYALQTNGATATGMFDLFLDNATTLSVTALNSTQLKFELQYTVALRVTGVSGKYQFVMQPK